jgi:hypothetical protein
MPDMGALSDYAASIMRASTMSQGTFILSFLARRISPISSRRRTSVQGRFHRRVRNKGDTSIHGVYPESYGEAAKEPSHV